MKSLRQLFLEMPLPIDMKELPKTKKGDFVSKYSPKQVKDHIANSFQALGKGSSRIGFNCPTSVELFHHDDRRKHELGDGNVDTVIKLALNQKGIFQNTVEIEHWINMEGSYGEQFLCPIFDWSGNPKYNNDSQYVLDCGTFDVDINSDYNGAYWIQMAKAIPASKNKKMFLKALKETFGELLNKKSYGNELAMLSTLIFSSYNRNEFKHNESTTKEQKQNLSDFLEMCSLYKIGDIGTFANWGIYKGKPVLIDYGFNDQTRQIYWDKQNINFLVFINKDGEVKIRFQQKERIRGY